MQDKSSAPKIFPISIIGHTSVGKTALLTQARTSTFDQRYTATCRPGSTDIILKIKEKNVRLQCWEYPARDSFFETNLGLGWNPPEDHSQQLAQALIIIGVFDLTDGNSLTALTGWIDKSFAASQFFDQPKPMIILVGNKFDCDNPQVTGEQIEAFRKRYSTIVGPIGYFATSARDGTNVVSLFQHVAELAPEMPLKRELQSLLKKYIDKITTEKTPNEHSGSTKRDFTSNFWIFRESRGMSQEANFYLAKALLERLHDGASVADAFTDIGKRRDEIITEQVSGHYSRIAQFINYIIRHLSPINSKELNAIINKAASAASRSPSPKA